MGKINDISITAHINFYRQILDKKPFDLSKGGKREMNNTSLIRAYGLEQLLTEQDDPLFWEAALKNHWTPVESPECLVSSLRFNIGRKLNEGETPVGEKNQEHANMRGMVDIEEWEFERINENQLKVKPATQEVVVPSEVLLNMNLSAIFTGQSSAVIPTQVVFTYLGISRPSKNITKTIVFAGTKAPGLVDGAAYFWQKNEHGLWIQTDQCISRWFS